VARFQVLPRDTSFFDMFESLADVVGSATSVLLDMFGNGRNAAEVAEQIGQMERQGDEITRNIMNAAHRAFVTPFDREDIHDLAANLDDILDYIESVAELIAYYGDKTPSQLTDLAQILSAAGANVQKAVLSLRDMSGHRVAIDEINRLENEGDRLYRKTMAAFFASGGSPLEVLKWKVVMDNLEDAIDGCEEVADVVGAIVLKHA